MPEGNADLGVDSPPHPAPQPGNIDPLPGIDSDMALWVDYDPDTVVNLRAKVVYSPDEGRSAVFAGTLPRWGAIARVAVPAALKRPGLLELRAVVLLRKGGFGLGVLDDVGTGIYGHTTITAPGLHFVELRAECPGPPGEVVLRSGLPETAEVEFELLALQFQLRPSQKRFKLQVSPTPEEAHPVFAKFPRWTGKISGYFTANWLGTLTDTRYTRNTRVFAETTVTPPVPKPSDEEYFEWIILLQSVLEARNSYTMVELGAGYGRWLVNAWSALRSIGKADISLTLIGVEAEPTHFAWMRQHFITNMLDPERHRLINAAVAASDGVVHFATGHPAEWYGQAIVPSASARMSQWSNMSVREVPAVSLETVLDGICVVDLVDMDIQGAEADVVRASAYLLAERVKRVFIGTHRAEIDRSLRETFRSLGWRCVYDYPCGRVSYTPYGFINFQDGVQSWVNPRLVSDTIENETASAF